MNAISIAMAENLLDPLITQVQKKRTTILLASEFIKRDYQDI